MAALLTSIQEHRTTHCHTLFNHPKFSITKPKKPIIQILSLQKTTHKQTKITKRTAAIKIAAATSSSLLLFVFIKIPTSASAFEFRITTPDQTVEEAEMGIQSHAQSLLKVKDLLKEESWKDAQIALRKNSAYLKQDIYTIIQSKPGIERSELRKMYYVLFSSVSDLDYAARDKDVPRVWECYDSVVLALYNILKKI